jgi:hypothetical protein
VKGDSRVGRLRQEGAVGAATFRGRWRGLCNTDLDLAAG